MKASLFNIFIDYQDYKIGFNTFYNTIILLNGNLYSILEKYFKKDNIEKLDALHPQLYKTLLDNKFVISNEVDELDIIRQRIETTNKDETVFEITINPTINCNFKCWYCYESHTDKSKITPLEIENIMLFINDIVSKNKKLKLLKIHWFGGEPLLHYKDVIVPIMEATNQIIAHTGITLFSGITTNGFLINEEILNFLEKHNHKTFQITIDGNKKRHNDVRYTRKGSNTYDVIVRNIILALEKGFYVSVRLNISEDTNLHVGYLLTNFSELSDDTKKRLSFSVHKVWQAPDYVEKIIETIVTEIRDNDFNCVTYFSNPTSIWNTCYADKDNHVVLNPKGEVFKCTARDYTKNNIEGHMLNKGVLLWDDIHRKRQEASVLVFEKCMHCKILPICNASCSQKKLENPGGLCPCNYDEQIKDEYARKVLFEKIELS